MNLIFLRLLTSKFMAVLLIGFIFLLNIIHPFIHGTPLDGGSMDMFIQYLNFIAFYYADMGE